jgi:hypothetical protein
VVLHPLPVRLLQTERPLDLSAHLVEVGEQIRVRNQRPELAVTPAEDACRRSARVRSYQAASSSSTLWPVRPHRSGTGARSRTWCTGVRSRCAAVPLLAPLADERGVQPLPPEQRAFALPVQAVALTEDVGLVMGQVGPWPAFPLRNLGVRCLVARATRAASDRGRSNGNLSPFSPSGSTIQAVSLSHRRLTQRVNPRDIHDR